MMVRYKRLGSPGAEGAFPIPTVRRRNNEQQQGDPPSHCDFWKSEQLSTNEIFVRVSPIPAEIHISYGWRIIWTDLQSDMRIKAKKRV